MTERFHLDPESTELRRKQPRVELSDDAKKAVTWLFNMKGELPVGEARRQIAKVYGREVDRELRDFFKLDS